MESESNPATLALPPCWPPLQPGTLLQLPWRHLSAHTRTQRPDRRPEALPRAQHATFCRVGCYQRPRNTKSFVARRRRTIGVTSAASWWLYDTNSLLFIRAPLRPASAGLQAASRQDGPEPHNAPHQRRRAAPSAACSCYAVLFVSSDPPHRRRLRIAATQFSSASISALSSAGSGTGARAAAA